MAQEPLPPTPPEAKGGSVVLTPIALASCKRLAAKYGTTQASVVDVALQSLESHLDHTSVIQVPELAMAVTDLREQVALLIGMGEDLEQLAIELLAAEVVPNE